MPRSGETLSLSPWERLVRAGRRGKVEAYIKLDGASGPLIHCRRTRSFLPCFSLPSPNLSHRERDRTGVSRVGDGPKSYRRADEKSAEKQGYFACTVADGPASFAKPSRKYVFPDASPFRYASRNAVVAFWISG